MLVMLEILGHFVTVLAGAVAIAGDTWHAANYGLKKITKTGWIAVFIALIGFCISIGTTILKHQDAIVRERAAAQEIHESWSVLASPFRVLLWQVDGAQPNPDIKMFNRLMEKGVLEGINNNIDMRGNAPHHYGPWLNLICESANNGLTELRQAQAIYVGIVGTDLITKIKNVVQSQALKYMKITAPCGSFSPSKDYFLKLHSIANLNDFEKYLLALSELKSELNKYVEK